MLAGELRDALGGLALGVDHVGSTSVPGLPAGVDGHGRTVGRRYRLEWSRSGLSQADHLMCVPPLCSCTACGN
ncbi:hypothetical protein ABTZ03_33960 [Kitasatospora sp. NPDC096077]|uniref:hypothetical protein n=1 Tax=Kitasatospora sp. NPDC096077 TaxID=3155544 RepID=UPI0033175F3D